MTDSTSTHPEPGLVTQLVVLGSDALHEHMPSGRADYLQGNVQRAPLEFLAAAALEEAVRAVHLIETFADDIEAFTAREDCELLCEQLAVRTRRLAETHVAVTLCGLTRDDAHPLHWLLLEKWSRLATANHQLQTDHGRRSPWLDHLTSEARTRAEAAANGLDLSRAWYLHPDRRGDLDLGQVRRAYSIFSSFGARLEAAFGQLDSTERFALGTSYEEAFGHASSLIHFSPTNPRDAFHLSNAGYWKIKVEFLALAVLHRVHLMLDAPATLRSARPFNTPEGDALSEDLMVRPRVQVGMRVVVHDLTGTVVAETTSRFGNRMVEVEFARQRPSPLIDRDWIPVRYVELA